MRTLVRKQEEAALFGLGAAALMVCCAFPLVVLGAELWSEDALAQLRTTLGASRPWSLLAKTTGLGLATTASALTLGVPLGVLLGRMDVAGRKAALWLHLFPVFLPPFLLALGWFQLFGTEGPLGSTWTSSTLFGEAGVVVTLTLALSPIVSALTVLGLHGINPSLEEAAQVVSSPWRTVTRILLPLCWPSIALGALIVFALSVSEVGVPMFLGVRTYSAAVFTRIGGIQYAPGEAVALILPLFAIGLVLVAIDRWVIRTRSFASLGVRSDETTVLPLGRARTIASALVWICIVAPLVPLGALAARAGPHGISEAVTWIRGSLSTSLLSSLLSSGVIVVIGVLVGHALARDRPLARTFDALALLTFMMPASVLGVGLIATWNHPRTQVVYTTMAILVLGLAARYAVIGTRALASVFARSPLHFEEAAQIFGSAYAQRLWRISLPMQARGVVGVWLIVLVFCLRDLDTVVVFYPPGLEPLVVRTFTLEANGPEQVVTGLSVLQVLLTAVLLAGGGLLLRRSWGRR
ncbi:MAG: ABC transporter permease subunit [Deltaproteobacteria bacterium]